MQSIISCFTAQHDFWLVALAALIAACAALTAFKTYSIAADNERDRKLSWIALTGLCAGSGIWAAHFVAMLAYDAGYPVAYGPEATLAALLVSVVLATAGFGMSLYGGLLRAAAGGAVVGFAIAAMHYLGMAALVVPGTISWDGALVGWSLLLGIGLASGALVVFHLLKGAKAIMAAAGLFTLAVWALHFTSMGGLTLVPDPVAIDPSQGFNRPLMAMAIACITFIILLSVLSASAIQWTNVRCESTLQDQNHRFEVALSNMPVGLSMFDPEHNLIMCNRIYREIYDLPAELTRPGTPFAEIMRYYVLKEAGGESPSSIEDMKVWLAEHFARLAQGKPFSDAHRLSDGRTVLVTIGPIADGGWVDVQEDITHRREHEARIEYMVRHDALTGLPNRVLLRERLEEALRRRRDQGEVVVHCLDLDHFKEVNDTLGHPIGDALLKLVVERLNGCVRETDFIARVGGDEFVVLQISEDAVNEASPLASRIIDAVSEPYELGGQQIQIGTSVGIALSPNDGTDPDTLLKNADMALYRAKSEGRGAWRLFEQEMNTRLHARFGLARDLRSALGNGELEVHYQPIVNLASGAVSCCEALLRWRHPERGMISPAEFIPVAEETGLIVPIGDWVLRQACAEAANWPDHVRIAVNISSLQWKNRTLSQSVFNAIAASHISPQRLEIEITESALLDNSEATIALAHQITNMGVRIAMDDFGTGYSSLSYLRKLPFDKIKIDRCFVKDLAEGGENAVAIIRAIAALGRALDLTVTAEGVETNDQLEVIRAEGCTEMQGYLFSRPLPSADVRKLLGGSAGKRREAVSKPATRKTAGQKAPDRRAKRKSSR